VAILDDCSGIRPRRHRKPDTENQKGVCDDTFSAMSVLLSNHVGELLTRLAGGRLMVLVACTAEGIWLLSFDSSRVPLGSHAPKSKAPRLFFKRALRILGTTALRWKTYRRLLSRHPCQLYGMDATIALSTNTTQHRSGASHRLPGFFGCPRLKEGQRSASKHIAESGLKRRTGIQLIQQHTQFGAGGGQ